MPIASNSRAPSSTELLSHSRKGKFMRTAILALAIAGIAGAGQTAVADRQPASAKKDRTVCRSVIMTGTRFEKRVCKAASEWEKIAEAQGDAYREQANRPVINRQGECINGAC